MSFKKQQREAAMIYQDIKPDQEVEADHIRPRSRGGADDVANLQFISPLANREKSNHMITLRDWQNRFLNSWRENPNDSFLCVVIPGGGKTIAALSAAKEFLDAANDRRVLIVVPTTNLQEQWRSEASVFGMNLQTKEFGTRFKDNFQGGVTTYQRLDTGAELFRKVCSTAPTLVILDEPHHCGDQESWGVAARNAFEPAKRRLLLSGTPFRTDGKPIPFVRYDGSGDCVADFRYDYPDAIKDDVVRMLAFDYSKGSYELAVEGKATPFDFNSTITEDEASKRLRHFLNPSGDFVSVTIRIAHEKLLAIRQSIPDAGAMAVCIDMMHAQKVADVIRRETGCEPSIIVSDEAIATSRVDEYRRSRREWLVSVRQVSEGTDIKRLQVLCYLTTTATNLAFRQLLGRISRVRFQTDGVNASDEATLADLEAFAYLPADPRLIEHASHIEEAQKGALAEIQEGAKKLQEPKERSNTGFDFLGSTHDGKDCFVIAGAKYNGEEYLRIERIANYGIPMEKAAKIFAGELRNAQVISSSAAAPRPQKTEEELIDDLRKLNHKLAFGYSKMIGCDVKEVNGQYKPHRKSSLKDLELKRDDLLRLMAAAKSGLK